MKPETLKKAKNLENEIGEYSSLIQSRNASYGYMLIKITCANANDHEDYHGRVDKDVWKKMLDVLNDERMKKKRELAALTDDSDEGAEAEVNEDISQKPVDDEQQPKKKRKKILSLFYALLLCLFLLALSVGTNVITCKMFGWTCDMGSITFSMVFSIIWWLCYNELTKD